MIELDYERSRQWEEWGGEGEKLNDGAILLLWARMKCSNAAIVTMATIFNQLRPELTDKSSGQIAEMNRPEYVQQPVG